MPNADSFQLPQEFLIVGAAVDTGLFDVLNEGPCSLEELAKKTGTDLRALWTVVEALVALDYLEYEDIKIKLTGEARAYLYEPASGKYIGFSFMHAYNLIASWVQLPEVLKSGQPASRKREQGQLRSFMRAMASHAAKDAPEIADHCLKGLPSNPTVLDVGGGPLTYARAFVQKGAAVTILDTPQVVDIMTPEIAPGQPITMVAGDFTVSLPEGPYNLVYLGNICHIYGERENKKLFADTAGVLKTGGRVAISDMIRGTGPRAALFAVNMLVNTASGGTWTYEQYKNWLEDAGLTVLPLEEVAGRQIITAIKQ